VFEKWENWKKSNCGDASSHNRQTRTVPTKGTEDNKYFDLKKKKTRKKDIILLLFKCGVCK